TKSTINGSWSYLYQNLLRLLPLAATDILHQMFGINDCIDGLGARALKVWQEANRAMCSFYRLKIDHQHTDASVVYSPGWANVVSTTENSGAGYKKSTTVGATITITIAPGHEGIVAPRFISPFNDGGGIISFTVDGVA